MAIAFVTGPMDSHRAEVNQQRGGPRSWVKQRRANPKQNAPTAKASGSSPSNNDYVARIMRSTAELSDNIKYFSYVVAYSTVGPSTSDTTKSTKTRKDDGDFEAAQRSSSGKRTNSVKSQAESAMSTSTKVRFIPETLPANEDPYGRQELLYPIARRRLREIYIRELEVRLREEKNLDEGWHAGRVADWFGLHLELQMKNEAGFGSDFVGHLRAAVRLHEIMMTSARVHQRDGRAREEDFDELWRDVVDRLNPAIFLAKPVLKHLTGNKAVSFDDFMEEWVKIVEETKWSTKTLVLFHCKSSPRWDLQKSK